MFLNELSLLGEVSAKQHPKAVKGIGLYVKQFAVIRPHHLTGRNIEDILLVV
jgi:hypothetical protein